MGSEKIKKIVENSVDNKKVFGAVVCIEKGEKSLRSTYAAGNLKEESQYFIASTTKIYTSAILFLLRNEGKVNLGDPIADYLPEEVIHKLHFYKGEDFSSQVTVQHLLAQTSGIPDYFLLKKANEESLVTSLTSGKDIGWTFEEAVERSKQMKPKFKPGQHGKAHYSDTNYQLLGKIIEEVTGKSLAEVFSEYIFNPLGLTQTYLYQNLPDQKAEHIYYKSKQLIMPKAMASFGSDGGIVSTANESMIFLRAFFDGTLFPKSYISEIQQWNRIFFPLQYGIGIARFKLPRLFSPFKPFPEFIGHSGLSGAFAYYIPQKDIYMTGTVNQIHQPGTSYRLMLKLLNGVT